MPQNGIVVRVVQFSEDNKTTDPQWIRAMVCTSYPNTELPPKIHKQHTTLPHPSSSDDNHYVRTNED